MAEYKNVAAAQYTQVPQTLKMDTWIRKIPYGPNSGDRAQSPTMWKEH